MNIQAVTTKNETDYKSVLDSSSNSTFFHSLAYRDQIESLTGATSKYYIGYTDHEPTGILPLFVTQNDEHGNILNSLPFYGSHGGAIIQDSVNDLESHRLKGELLSKAEDVAEKENCTFSTIINTPYEEESVYQRALNYDYTDVRIGQIKYLPESNEEETLLYDVEKRCRTAIRKAEKEGVTVFDATSDDQVRERLISEHQNHMESIGGKAKPEEFFRNLEHFYEPREEFKIYAAEYEGEIAGLLLLFYFQDTIEYFTPVTIPEYRDIYPMNYLIYEAMCDGIDEGYQRWNFGGTWTTQDGVYKFKKSFQPREQEYHYYINQHEEAENLLSLSKEQIDQEYPWFYVVPYDKL